MTLQTIITQCPHCLNEMDVTNIAPFTQVQCPHCGTQSRVNTRMGNFELQSRLGIGGMSIVFAAIDSTLDRPVAVKILNETYSANTQRAERFETEARVMASVSHPNIVKVYTVGVEYNRYFIAMELISGANLERMIMDRGELDEEFCLRTALQVSEGLLHAYDAGLLHRDMKPANILIDEQNNARIVDFGLALLVDEQEHEEEIWATPYYVAPETLNRQEEDFRTDMYALGATMYHALCGKPSCELGNNSIEQLRQAKQHIEPIANLRPTLSPQTCHIIDKCLSYEPSRRYASYAELIRALRQAINQLGNPQAQNPTTSKRRQNNTKLRYAAIVAGLLGVGFIGFKSLSKSQQQDPQDNSAKPAQETPATPNEPGNSGNSDSLAAKQRISQRLLDLHSQARSALDHEDLQGAAALFAEMGRMPQCPFSTKVRALFESALCNWQLGQTGKARAVLGEISQLVKKQPENQRGDNALLELCSWMQNAQSTPPEQASFVQKEMLGDFSVGIKAWELGDFAQAKRCFERVLALQIPEDKQWMTFYQQRAGLYLQDLSGLEQLQNFDQNNLQVIQALRAKLNDIKAALRTKGRSELVFFDNELLLARLEKRLQAPSQSGSGKPQPSGDANKACADVNTALKLLSSYQFKQAANLLDNPAADEEQQVTSLQQMCLAAEQFKQQIIQLLGKKPDAAKDKKIVSRLGSNPQLIGLDSDKQPLLKFAASDHVEENKWETLKPESWLEIYRGIINDETDSTKRNKLIINAIAYLKLFGLNEQANTAAELIIKSDEQFRDIWSGWKSTSYKID